MKNKKIIYYWACDISSSSGEGILGNSFIKKLKSASKNVLFVNINLKDRYQRKKINIKENIFNSNFHKYIYPLKGLLQLWFFFVIKGKMHSIIFCPLNKIFSSI